MDTELHYLTYDPDEMWLEMMKNYIAEGGDFLYPGDEKEMLLRSVQANIVQAFAAVDNALRMTTLRYATKTYLEILGENRNCPRIMATGAKATVTITTNVTGEETILEAGTKMTADGVIFYLLDEDLTLSGYQETLTADVTCERTGVAGNALTSGTELALAITNRAVYSIVAATDAAGGNEIEEQETYRERIRQSGLTAVTTGPQQQYEATAKAVSSEIIDARAINSSGQVYIYLIISDDATANTIMQEVQDTLNADSVRPLTDQVTIFRATDIEYTLNVQYKSEIGVSESAAISKAVSDYQAWQDNVIGRPFNPDRLVAALYSAGASQVAYGSGSNFNSGAVEYTEITQAQRCKGTITITKIT